MIDLSGKRVLVTGGGGFIGSNLVRALQRSGAEEVRVIDDFSTGYRQNLADVEVRVIERSILDDDALSDAMDGVDAVVHLAALGSVPRSIEDPRRSFTVNAVGTMNLLEACRRHETPHVITVSSSSVYGSNPNLPRTELDWTAPMSPYAASKLAGEGLTLAYGHCYGMRVLPFRFFNVFGPFQAANHPYAAVIPRFLQAALDREPLSVHGDGLQSRDFTYVDTIVDTLIDAISRQVIHSTPVNLAFGTSTTLLDVIEVLEGLLGREVEREFLPPRAGDVRASASDGVLLRQLFPDISPIGLDEGLQATLEWFRR
ncbi:epimerase [Marmoricola endophyticus]|uniref:Epimerase n=1 Tax=Marmoricola endophyticus TaxID=2040280 RepID=A0A917BIM6_9ACTN|nr:NAD-dependent epimerase/dehydratase family protein [Marmoricola endophyticus]GGF43678.1 epimerase [Marmoricola endophyticus]